MLHVYPVVIHIHKSNARAESFLIGKQMKLSWDNHNTMCLELLMFSSFLGQYIRHNLDMIQNEHFNAVV